MAYGMSEETQKHYRDKYIRRDQLMTDKEMKEVDERITKLILNRGEMEKVYARWEEEEKAYKGDQDTSPKRPNTRINLVNANIEGQLSALVDQNISVVTRGESPSDQQYAEWARVGLDWTLRKNRIKRILKSHDKRRLLFGEGLFKVYFDEDEFNGFGLAKICTPPLTKIFIDNKVKDYLRFQEAEYIAETIRMSKQQFEDIYGEEKASCINYGTLYIEDTETFKEEETTDDENSATLIQWWERHKGKLRLIEFTSDGLLLYDSHKKGDRMSNQKKAQYDHKPYYKFVNNRYPYFFTPLYVEEGTLHGFGDGKLLRPINDMINDLYDKIRIAARPNLILFDPDSEVDLEDFDENSFEPRPARLSERKTIEFVPWGTVNPSWWQLLSSMHQEAQRVTRFSDLMMGQGRSSETATEASIQQQQGNATTDHKKQMLQETLVEVCEYILGLMMEFYKGAKAFRIAEDKEEYQWIDFRQLGKVPALKQATEGFSKQYKEKNGTRPEWEAITDNKGNPMTKNVDLDIEISIGAGLPKNKAFLWNMIEKLSGLVVQDQNGQPRNLINYEELRGFLKDFLGLPLKDEQMEQILQQPAQPLQQLQQPQPSMSADANLSSGGNPLMSMLPGGGLNG